MRIKINDLNHGRYILNASSIHTVTCGESKRRLVISINEQPRYYIDERSGVVDELEQRLLVDGYIDLTPYKVYRY